MENSQAYDYAKYVDLTGVDINSVQTQFQIRICTIFELKECVGSCVICRHSLNERNDFCHSGSQLTNSHHIDGVE